MQDEIRQIIEKNLPAQMGEILKKRLEQADQDAHNLAVLRDTVKAKEATIEEQAEKIKRYKADDERNSKLDEREKALNKKELDMEKTILELKLAEAKARYEVSENFLTKIFSNTGYRQSVWGNIPMAVGGGPNYPGFVQAGNTVQLDTTHEAIP